jgi:ABC-2 type transport system permease protein
MTAYLMLELRRMLRDRRYMAMVIAWPVASYLLFSTVFGAAADRAEGLSPHVEIMVAMAAFGAIGAVLIGTGPKIALERQSGWTRQLGLTPLTSRAVFAVRVIAALVLAGISVALTFATAFAFKGVSLAWWEWPAMFALLVAGTLPFAGLGVLIGDLGDGDTAFGATNIIYLAMAALGGLWMPTKILPAPMRTVAHLLPSNRLADLGWHVAGGHAPTLAAAGVLGAWSIVAVLLVVAVAERRLAS